MPWTEIEPVYFKQNKIKKLDKIIKKSEKRVKDNAMFSMIDERAKWLLSLQEDTEVSLSLDKYKEQQDDFNEASEKYKDLNKDSPFLTILPPAADRSTLESDTIRAKSIENWHKNLKKDPYLEEAVQIVSDWH
jgi:carboxyl-terminal processing protease